MAVKKNVKTSQEFSESIINTVREPLIVLDQDLRVVTVSRSFYEVFKVKPEETVGQLIYDLGNKQWDIPKLRELLETILPEKTTFDNYEVEHDFVYHWQAHHAFECPANSKSVGKGADHPPGHRGHHRAQGDRSRSGKDPERTGSY